MGSTSDDEQTNPSMGLNKNDDAPIPIDDEISSGLSNDTSGQPVEYCLLPPLLLEHRDRKTLVLDLDETLVHAFVNDPPPHYDFLLEFPADAVNDFTTIYVMKRPGVHEFLEAAAKLFEVVVFTAASRSYANAALDRLDVNGTLITHRLDHYDCTPITLILKNDREEEKEEVVNVKDLAELGRDLSKTVIVDNSPIAYILQPENALPISSYFEYEPNDCELSRVMTILRTIVESNDDVRDVLKQLQVQNQVE